MPIGRYRITSPTIAMVHEDGRHVAHTIPVGALISIDGAEIDGNQLIEVTWNARKMMMFTQDLRSRSEAAEEK